MSFSNEARLPEEVSFSNEARLPEEVSFGDEARLLGELSFSSEARLLEEVSFSNEARLLKKVGFGDEARLLEEVSSPIEARLLEEVSFSNEARLPEEVSFSSEARLLGRLAEPEEAQGARRQARLSSVSSVRGFREASGIPEASALRCGCSAAPQLRSEARGGRAEAAPRWSSPHEKAALGSRIVLRGVKTEVSSGMGSRGSLSLDSFGAVLFRGARHEARYWGIELAAAVRAPAS